MTGGIVDGLTEVDECLAAEQTNRLKLFLSLRLYELRSSTVEGPFHTVPLRSPIFFCCHGMYSRCAGFSAR